MAIQTTQNGAFEELVTVVQREGRTIQHERRIDNVARIIQIAGQVVIRSLPVADVQDAHLGTLGTTIHDAQVEGLDQLLKKAGDVVILHLATLRGHVEALDANLLAGVDQPLQRHGIVAEYALQILGALLGSLGNVLIAQRLTSHLIGRIDRREDVNIVTHQAVQLLDHLKGGAIVILGHGGNVIPRLLLIEISNLVGALLELHLQYIGIGLQEVVDVASYSTLTHLRIGIEMDKEGTGDIRFVERTGYKGIHQLLLIGRNLRTVVRCTR